MVANLSAHKRGWDDKWEYYSNSGEKGMFLQSQLLDLVDEDTDAFNSIMNAFSLPKDTDDEKVIRNNQSHIRRECWSPKLRGLRSSRSSLGVGTLSP